jgi:hypothetical protein
MNLPPSDAATLERARSLCNEACFTVALQCRRLRSIEPEDKVFILRPCADFQFLVVALRRLKRAAEIATRVSSVRPSLKTAIAEFDRKLPFLNKMRNVGEHIDSCAIDDPKRHHGDVQRIQLQVASCNDEGFTWLDQELKYDVALEASEHLFRAIKSAMRAYHGKDNRG